MTTTEKTLTGLTRDAAEEIVDHYGLGRECLEWLQDFLAKFADDVESAKADANQMPKLFCGCGSPARNVVDEFPLCDVCAELEIMDRKEANVSPVSENPKEVAFYERAEGKEAK